MRYRRFLVVVFILLWTDASIAQLSSSDFPVDESVRVRVDFWKKVYTEISTSEGFLHDSDDLSVIYMTVKPPRGSRRARMRHINYVRRQIRERLKSIIVKDKEDLSAEEKKLVKRTKDAPVERLRSMVHRIRYQRGLRDHYFKGLVQSYKYLPHIRRIFQEEGLPKGLEFLPHVESAFNYKAYSKVGAAGLWQFMRATARRFKLRVNYMVDQRRDPIDSTRAAARFLKRLHDRLGAWPLALTAYNHGPASVARAVRQVNSKDIGRIIREYEGRRFGFASKNFYSTFIATAEISQTPEKYFGNFSKPKAFEYDEFELPKKLTLKQVSKTSGIKQKTLEQYNRSLRRAALNSSRALPKGFKIKVPKRYSAQLGTIKRNLASVKYTPPKKKKPGGTHVVSRGQSLYFISQIYKVSISDLVAINGLNDPSRIYPGMRLKIPSDADRKALKNIAAEKIRGGQKEEARQKRLAESHQKNFEELKAILESQDKRLSKPEPVKKSDFLYQVDEEARQVDTSAYQLKLNPLKNGVFTLKVEADETLGHYAEWAGISASKIRNQNKLSFRENIQLGQYLKIPISKTKVASFNSARLEFHAAIEEDFFANYRVKGTSEYLVRKGDSVDKLVKDFEVPFWLLRRYQTDKKFELVAGQTVRIPKVVKRVPAAVPDENKVEQ